MAGMKQNNFRQYYSNKVEKLEIELNQSNVFDMYNRSRYINTFVVFVRTGAVVDSEQFYFAEKRLRMRAVVSNKYSMANRWRAGKEIQLIGVWRMVASSAK